MSSEETKRKALALLKSGVRAVEVAKQCRVNVGTIYAWKSRTPGPGGKPNGAHHDAIVYLRHAEVAMTEDLRTGRIKKLTKAHLLALLALNALGA